MKLAVAGLFAAASLAAVAPQASAQTVREEIHREHVAVRHALHHRHRVCMVRHHHRVCHLR